MNVVPGPLPVKPAGSAPRLPRSIASCPDTDRWQASQRVSRPACQLAGQPGNQLPSQPVGHGWLSGVSYLSGVVDCDGVLVAAAFGVPPRWLTTIQ
jgi:hypothetical protein